MAEYVKGQRVRFTTGNLGVLDSFGRPTDDTVGERTDYTHGMYFGRHDPLDDWHVIAVDINGDERYAPVHESMFEVTTISESIDRIRDAYQAWSVIPPSDRARERNATANLHDATGALRDLYDNEHREQLRTRLSAAADAWCDATDGDDQAPLTDQIDHAHQLHAATTAYLAEHHADDPTRGPDGHPVWGTITITDRGGSWGAHLEQPGGATHQAADDHWAGVAALTALQLAWVALPANVAAALEVAHLDTTTPTGADQ